MHRKEIRVIIDANLWISFLIGMKSVSAIRQVLENESFVILMTEQLEHELRTVAMRPKFSKYFGEGACSLLLHLIRKRAEYHALNEVAPRCRDPKDDYLLELAVVAKADCLLTGDKDLLEMGCLGNCRILRMEEFTRKLNIK